MRQATSPRRVVGAVAAVTLVAGALAQSPASANSADDWFVLAVDPAGCSAPWDKDPAFCGPDLVVRTVWPTMETVTVEFSLEGPGGAVPLESPRTISGNGRPRPPSMPTGLGWGGAYADTRTPTGLAPGRYTLSMNYAAPGRWTCSVFDRQVCRYADPYSGSERYTFDWTGEAKFVVPEYTVSSFSVSPSKTRKGQKTLLLEAFTGGTRYRGKDRVVSFERLDGQTWTPLATAKDEAGGARAYVKVPAQRAPLTIRAVSPSAPNDPGKTVTIRNMR